MKETDQTFHTDQVATVAGAHFVHDSYSAFLAPLLPMLQERLSTNYAMTGVLAMFPQLPSLLNPFIGYLADRVSLRYFIILAPAITATLMSSIGLTSNYVMLAMLLVAVGFSVSAFHAPAPAMIARVSGNRVGKGMSAFMASGELGRTIGPIAAVAGVAWFGLEGMWRMAFVGWAVSGILYLRLRHVAARPQSATDVSTRTFWPKARQIFPMIALLLLTRTLMTASLTTYLPLYVHDVLRGGEWLQTTLENWENAGFLAVATLLTILEGGAMAGAAALTMLEGAGVVGALFAGTFSDKLGRVKVLLGLTAVSALFMIAFLNSPGWLIAPLLVGLGLTAISPQPVLLAVIQDEFTDNRALANGSYMTVSFAIRSMGIWAIGYLADQSDLQTAFLIGGLIMFMGIPAVILLGKKAESVQ